MGNKVVQDDHGTRLKGWGELGLYLSIKCTPIHGTRDNPRRDEVVGTEACDKGLCLPASKGGNAEQALADGTASSESSHVCFDRGFINKHQPLWQVAHARLTVGDPFLPVLPEVSAFSLLSNQAFFLYERPDRTNAR